MENERMSYGQMIGFLRDVEGFFTEQGWHNWGNQLAEIRTHIEEEQEHMTRMGAILNQGDK